jgi:hypothetical protein
MSVIRLVGVIPVLSTVATARNNTLLLITRRGFTPLCVLLKGATMSFEREKEKGKRPTPSVPKRRK